MKESFLNIKLKSKGTVLNVNGDKVTINKSFEKRLGDKGLLQKDVQAIAKMIRDKITSNIYRGKRYDTGGNVKPLTNKAYIKRKGSSRVLINTGKMLQGVMVAKEGSNYVVRMKKNKYPKVTKPLGPGRNRKTSGQTPTVEQVASWVNVERPFFGINKKDLKTFTKAVITDRLFKK